MLAHLIFQELSLVITPILSLWNDCDKYVSAEVIHQPSVEYLRLKPTGISYLKGTQRGTNQGTRYFATLCMTDGGNEGVDSGENRDET